MKKRPQVPGAILFEKNRESKKNIRSWIGRVSSNRMDKTATVVIPRMVFNKHLMKHFREFKKFKAHDQHNETRIGDIVRIHFDRKRSKTKSFIVTEIITPNRTGYEPLWPLERQPASLNPENALAPQVYLPQDIYRDDVTGLKAPYLADYVMSAQGTGPSPTKPPRLGKTEFHPFDSRWGAAERPILEQLAADKVKMDQHVERVTKEQEYLKNGV